MENISPRSLLDSLNWRYATKVFDPDKKIPTDHLAALEDSLILSPSSFGLQPWRFEVITNNELRKELLPHSWNQAQVTDCSHFVVLSARENLGEEEIKIFLQRTAEVRGVPIETLDGYGQMMSGFIGNMDDQGRLQWAKLQTYIALGQLMASAAVLGIDACPMEGIAPNEYDRILGLPQIGYRTTVACALGYRSADDKYAELAKVRFEKEALLSRRT
ncbi:NAD(P)H-dependent oxidoreductase [Akkermansiaceae bacterium]|nr:NAD(P)H-dependent oxidoreductase [Akkermansiaceae bacterium]